MIRVSIVGSGNVAQFICKSLQDKVELVEIIGRNKKTLYELALKYNIQAQYEILKHNKNIDALIIAVPDDAINEVLATIENNFYVIIHTSGVFNNDAINCLWPVISINANSLPTLTHPPIAYSISNNRDMVIKIATFLSNNIYEVSFNKKDQMHLIATIGNNFSNHIMSICFNLSKEMNIPFDLFIPLYQQVTNGLSSITHPELSQTGAAKRNDINTMKHHNELIKDDSLKEWYNMMSKMIINYQKKNA
jgi:hypothetical protein